MPNDWKEAVGVNLTACWRLIRTCDPPLRAAPAGRAVLLTDSVAAAPGAFWGLYGFGKAGQQHLAQSWAAEVAHTPLRVNLADPGPVATNLRANAMPGEDAALLRRPADVAPAPPLLVAVQPADLPPAGLCPVIADLLADICSQSPQDSFCSP
jgi:NAD(P)-dependent dehydrogenase (short-subunit alcohol dehydrogenase family)